MLDIVNVVRRSNSGKFDTIVFFDRDGDAVTETQKRIPGAVGFTGSFTGVVLAGGPEPDNPDESDTLASPADVQDTFETRDRQRILNQRDQFVGQFPFDIINLDLEEFAFKPNDPFPGDVVRAIRKVVTWQKRPRTMQFGGKLKKMAIDGFTLMFTTQVGPPNISVEYVEMLRNYLRRNVEEKPERLERLRDRVGIGEIAALEAARFDEFFKLLGGQLKVYQPRALQNVPARA